MERVLAGVMTPSMGVEVPEEEELPPPYMEEQEEEVCRGRGTT
jgi:hypothetical protein